MCTSFFIINDIKTDNKQVLQERDLTCNLYMITERSIQRQIKVPFKESKDVMFDEDLYNISTLSSKVWFGIHPSELSNYIVLCFCVLLKKKFSYKLSDPGFTFY